GEGVVTAADITHDSDVEILNPDLHIATLAENGSLRMRLTAQHGRGYTPAHQNKREDHPIVVIPIDSIYTPVSRVNYQVEKTRVGQVANYDKLSLDVWTDGSIGPKEAVSLGAKILTEHLNIFVNLTDEAQNAEIMVEKEEDQKEKVLEMTIEELDLSV
ncbi:DNA-directed RNA polymerase subunit alpha, partial [Geobacillus sp. NFOSA3]|nr:DNA-directed RNA polymerase subunit alpha [Geobacillus sp. NFOSA3]